MCIMKFKLVLKIMLSTMKFKKNPDSEYISDLILIRPVQ